MRRLVLLLGDQLSHANPALEGFDPATDSVLMIEARGEGELVWSHKARIALFLSAMRHFRDELVAQGLPVVYRALDADSEAGLPQRLAVQLQRLQPAVLRMAEAGEWRLDEAIAAVCAAQGVTLQRIDDTHYLCSKTVFNDWADGQRGSLRMEFFYRQQRRRLRVLMDADGTPAGGRWNFDPDNRKGWPRSGPGDIAAPARFEPDAITREVFALVEREFAGHPGALASFGWPVTRAQALQALERFIALRLPQFGSFQDAMWTATPWGWHSLLSSSLNLHLLDPREVVAAAELAWRQGDAPLASVEGFVRQIIGWREFIRGVYWRDMPGLAAANHYGHDRPLPAWYWTGATHMACLADSIGQTLAHGYAHHIQRLMVTGLFALLAGIEPRQVAAWYLAVYVDAVEWVELPNVAGMSLFADGGRFTSKPYVASGAYIDRQSNYCRGCRYKPSQRSGPDACPITVLYWAFLDRHEPQFAANPRTVMMVKHVQRMSDVERDGLRREAGRVLHEIEVL